ncbi:E3 ubiquitin-protein ligase Topors-like [Tropilaelaps mercedesae]|uniref:E3 ubiquitin-protein ligase Topors n=1 Tax=Tropilaelaps mercedesae TaxID=418985 RepID=A0A1V9XNL0_9ACAR|nr:E3 ubiquitin-protein ligase Topors-like [Tropilaelaps mercedesae]
MSGSPPRAGGSSRRWGSPSTAGPSTASRPGSGPRSLSPQTHNHVGLHRGSQGVGNGGGVRARATPPGYSGTTSMPSATSMASANGTADTTSAAATRSSPSTTPKFVSRNVSPPVSPQRSNSASSSSSEDPDNTCAICLGKPSNKSFTDACYHPFCFSCLVEWSRVKATCPLCQKPFRTIVHNIKENYEFEQYHIFQHLRAPPGNTVTIVRGTTQAPFPSTSTERRGIYEMGYYARPSGYARYREATAEFYLNNPAQTHRLIPWLNRELLALLPPPHSVSLVLEVILAMICNVDIRSVEMRQMLDLYLRPYTAHFQHEFYCFASSAHDMVMYDRNVEYEYRPPLSYHEAVERLRRAFERETIERLERGVGQGVVPRLGAEPGVVGQSAFRPWSPQPGPSRVVVPTTSSPQPSTSGIQLNNANTSGSQRSTLVIVSSSDDTSDDDDDCQIVKVIKPYRERTPVLIDLCNDSTDSDSSEADTIPAEGSGEPASLPEAGEPTSPDDNTNTEDEDNNDPITRGRRKSIIGAYYPAGASMQRASSNDGSDDSRNMPKTLNSPKSQKGTQKGKQPAKRQRSRSHSNGSSKRTKRCKGKQGTSKDEER